MKDPQQPVAPGTRAVHGPGSQSGPIGTPIVHSATYAFDSLAAMLAERDHKWSGAYYQRHGHPTLVGCERRLAFIEGAETALLFSSGMAAISSVLLAYLKSGDHVVALRQSYGGTEALLRWGADRFGWSFTQVDARQPSDWESAFRPETRFFQIESPTNPTLCVSDLGHAATVAHRHRALLGVDNTIASPLGQHPLALGADIVTYSATKSIGGHSDLLAGVAVGSAAALEPVWKVRTTFGGVADPQTAWLIERSLKTLPLRVERANAGALELAHRLQRHRRVREVFYPGLSSHPDHDVAKRQMSLGFGPLLSFEVEGGLGAAERLVEGLELVRHAPSLGGVESLASLPAHTSHVHLTEEQRSIAGIPAGLVRLSVGVEDVDDLWRDLERALERSQGG